MMAANASFTTMSGAAAKTGEVAQRNHGPFNPLS
jgi:hypothetical protein